MPQIDVSFEQCQRVPHHARLIVAMENAPVSRDSSVKPQRQVFEELHKAGIGVNLHYIPVRLQTFYGA
jgi:hypothetical protein